LCEPIAFRYHGTVSFWYALLEEAWAARTPFVVLAWLVAFGLARSLAIGERRRMRFATLLIGAHLVMVPVIAMLRIADRETQGVEVAALAVVLLALVYMGSVVSFGAVLPRLGLRVPTILRDIVTAVVIVAVVIAVANRAGFSVAGLITTSAILTAVIGFSMQDTLGNMMGGLALQLDNSVQVGDWIQLAPGQPSGRVTEIRWRYTAIETRAWETIIIPNSVLMKSQVVVQGRRVGEPVQFRRSVDFYVDFRTSPSDVIETVTPAIVDAGIDNVAARPVPHVMFFGIKDSFAHYVVRFWLEDIAIDDPTDSAVRTRVYFALRRAGIPLSIPAAALFVTEEDHDRSARKLADEHARKLAALRGVDIFDDLDDAERDRLAKKLEYAPFTRNEQMTRQGAADDCLYIIVEGEAAVQVASGDEEREVARLGAGTFFGEMSLITGERRSASVIARDDVVTYRLGKDAFQELLHRHPEFAERIADVLANRRVELAAARDNLDAKARSARMATDKQDLLGRIRGFFGLREDQR
jgi:small-conductance mechanosensitive channel/CRP-like cAMP-binding protein